jgi:hypothetical protein
MLLECRTLSWKLEHPSKKPIPEGSCLCNSFVPFNYLFPNPSVGYGICEKGEGFGCFVCWMNYVKSWSNIWSKKMKKINIFILIYVYACLFLFMCAQRVQ